MQRITGPRRSSKQEQEKEGKGEKPVLFLMHGLLASAFDWIGNLPEQSFAFLAADAGRDDKTYQRYFFEVWKFENYTLNQ